MNNLKLLRKRKGVSQKGMAEILNVSISAYNMYENGTRTMNPDVLSKLSDFFGVSIDVILGRENIAEPFGREIVEQPVPEFEDEVYLPIVASLHCGYGTCGEPYTVTGKHPVPKSYLKKYGKDIVLCYASGLSMLPTIRPGDLMVCYPGDMWDDGSIVIVNVNDSDTVKRIYRAADGGIDLIPDNTQYQCMHYSKEDIEIYQIHVLGHVVTTIPPEIKPIPRRR